MFGKTLSQNYPQQNNVPKCLENASFSNVNEGVPSSTCFFTEGQNTQNGPSAIHKIAIFSSKIKRKTKKKDWEREREWYKEKEEIRGMP